jgi:hypothetical protein
MSAWFLAAWLFLAACVIGAWILFLRWQDRHLPRRSSSATPPSVLFTALGGGRAGMVHYTWPLVRLVVDDEGVVFRFGSSTASVGWRDISRALLVRPRLRAGRGVEFQLPENQPLTFWGADESCRRVLDLCEQHAVTVVREPTLRL